MRAIEADDEQCLTVAQDLPDATTLAMTQCNDTVYRSALACALRNARPCQ